MRSRGRVVLVLAIALVAAAVSAFLYARLTAPRSINISLADDAVTIETPSGPATRAAPLATRPKRAAHGAPEPTGCSIVGVVTLDGKPAKAEITVRRTGDAARWGYPNVGKPAQSFEVGNDRPVVGRATSGDDGRFLVERLPTGRFSVVGVGAGGTRAAGRVAITADGERASVSLSLATGTPLHGRVTLEDATPWSGVVLLRDAAKESDLAEPLTVATDGRFAFESVAAGVAKARFADGSGRSFFEANVTLPRADEWLVTAPAGRPFTGRVVEAADEAAIGGASVFVFTKSEENESAGARATTDGEGRFVAIAPATGRAWAVIEASGHASLTGWFDEAPGGETVFRMKKTARIEGVVAQADGTPVGGLEVRAYSVDLSNGTDFAIGAPRSDAQGRFEFEVEQEGRGRVVAWGDGWISESLREPEGGVVSVKPGETANVTVTVVRGLALRGVVVDSGGAGIPGAIVSAQPTRSRQGTLVPQGLIGRPHTTTDARGRFELTLDPDFEHTLYASAHGYRSTSIELARPTGPAYDDVELRLGTARTFEIRVVDDDTGEPIARATAGVSVVNGAGMGGMTGPDGWSIVEGVGDGPATTSVSAEGYIASAERIPLTPDVPTTVRLKKGAALAGRVTLEDGTPLPGLNVVIDDDRRRGNVTTRDDGSWKSPAVKLGRHRVAVGAYEMRPLLAERDVEAGRDDLAIVVTRAELEAAHAIVVVVLDAAGRRVPRVSVGIFHGSHSDRSTNAPGVQIFFLRSTPPPRTVSVAAMGARDAAGARLALGPVVQTVSSDVGVVTLRLPTEQKIAGRVVGPGGTPVGGAVVLAAPQYSIDDSEDSQRGQALASVWEMKTIQVATGADGAFEIGGLGAGPHGLGVQPLAGWLPFERVWATAGDRDVVLELRRAAQPVVTVLDPDGKPIADGYVAVADERGMWIVDGLRTDREGRARVDRVSPTQRYRLVARGHDDKLEGAVIEGWQASDIDVRLRKPFTIEGRVVDEEGREPGGFYVAWRQGERTGTGETRADGTFRISGVGAGEADLTVDLAEGGSVRGSKFTRVQAKASAGDANVRIVLPVGPVFTVRIDGDAPRADAPSVAHLIAEVPKHSSLEAVFAADGVARFRRCETDTSYTLWVPPSSDDGRFVYETGLRAPGDLMARRRTGGTITVRVTGAEKGQRVYAYVERGPIQISGSEGADGAITIVGVPPGQFTVRASSPTAESMLRMRTGTATATAGQTVDIEVRPDAR